MGCVLECDKGDTAGVRCRERARRARMGVWVVCVGVHPSHGVWSEGIANRFHLYRSTFLASSMGGRTGLVMRGGSNG
jgi:hypothetical protein